MNNGTRIMIIAGLAVLLCSQAIFARFDVWQPENGIPVRQAPHLRWEGSISEQTVAQNEDGEFCVVWSATIDGAQNIFAQLYNSDCEAQWDENGIQVSSAEWMQYDPRVISCGDYGWYVGWLNYRDLDGLSGYEAHYYSVQRVSSNGDLIWDDEGINPAPEEGELPWGGNRPFFFPCGDGSFISVWEDSSYSTFAQKFDQNGSPLWDDYVQVAPNISKISSDCFSGIIVAWGNRANRISSTGELMWGEDVQGIEFVNRVFYNNDLEFVPDGNGGAFALWMNNGIWGQHINVDGETQWGRDGENFFEGYLEDHYLDVAYSSPQNIIFSWQALNMNDYGTDLRAQQIESRDGEAVTLWGEDDSGILIADHTNGYGWLSADSYGGAVFTWHAEELFDGTGEGFELLHVDSEGEISWDSPRSSHTIPRYYLPAAPVAVENTAAIIWMNFFSDQQGLYINGYDLETGDPYFENEQDIVEDLAGWISDPSIIKSDENVFNCWIDSRYAGKHELPFLQRVDIETGEAQWTNNGINVAPGFLDQNDISWIYWYNNKDLFPDGFGGAIVNWSWEAEYEPGHRVKESYYQRIDESGDLLWAETGISPDLDTQEGEEEFKSRITLPTNDGGFILIYSFLNYESGSKIVAQQFNGDGEPQWNYPSGLTLIESVNTLLLHKAHRLDDDSFLLFYTDQSYEVLYAMRVDEDGESVWGDPLQLFELNDRIMSFHLKTCDDNIIVFVCLREHVNFNQIYHAQCFNDDGELRWGNEGLTYETTRLPGDEIALAAGVDDDFWISWQREDCFEIFHYDLDMELLTEESFEITEGGKGLRNQRLIPDTEGGIYFIWGENSPFSGIDILYTHINNENDLAAEEYTLDGIYLTNAPYLQSSLEASHDGEGGFLAAWSDFRGSGSDYGDDAYIMRINDRTVGVAKDATKAIPQQYSLEAVYPNPFNSSLNIQIGLPLDSKLQIKLYNILGKEVAVIADGFYRAGSRRFVWNTDNLASGIYFVQAEVPGKMEEVRKIVLIK
ncbi:MAG: T9SS type A sorting domain-containing protein [Candidatus Electryonea clarkiae]|nr:T9SS type A sorting domain-containing protein [Candidatus Electryonea clarkiae]MDP8286377.1 T9SS type A sorting domain-containing protein [Candidatus Electryonea clarkiae]